MEQRKTGQFIANHRRKMGLTQVQLAEKLNVSNRTVSKWETGNGFPDVSLLEPLADALQFSVIGLLRGESVEAAHDSDVREAVRVLSSVLKKQLRHMRRIAGTCVLLLILLTIGQGIIEFLATHGDGYDNGINAHNTRIWYENLCGDFASRGVYQIDVRVENKKCSITDLEEIKYVLEKLAQIELGQEYRDGESQSLAYSICIYTSGWTPDGRFIKADSQFDLTFPAFSVQYPVMQASDLEPEENICLQADDDDTFYFNAGIEGEDAWTVLAEVLGECTLQ